jgi:hypothetical protein
MTSTVFVRSGQVMGLGSGITSAPTAGNWQFKDAPKSAIQAVVTGSGTVTATIVIEVSNDGVNPVATPLGTITINGTAPQSDGFTTDAPWKFIRARVTAISGTSASVAVNMSA